jgi:type IV fimbrial biogenesis protein FimT
VKHSRAFTLIELVVTIAVLAIVMGLAVPGFNSFIQSNRVTGHANGMVSALAFARSEAVNRSEQVRFCPVNAAGNGCDDDGDWSTGWIALVQSGPDAGEVLRIWPPVPGSLTLSHEAEAELDSSFVDLLPLGNVATGNGNFVYRWTYRPTNCAAGRPHQRTVDLARSGRAQVLQEECEA